jgi:serine/threonine protein kinase/WD40 repeat protein/Flp pilus assembly protein TadD
MDDASDARLVLLNQLADEFAARHRAGDRPRVEEYCEKHPDLADDIRSLFPALVELERARADAGAEPAVAAAAAPPVTQLGDFRLLREVGRGGMGVVYEAEQVSLGRRVAIKLLPAAVFRDPTKRRRFEREAKAAAKLHHTNIVPVHGCGEYDGTPYYVMQFIPGLGLDAVIDELRHAPAGGRTPGPERPPASGQSALSVALARSLLGEDGGKTVGWNAPAGDAPTTTSAGGRTPDPAPPARPDRGSSGSHNASGIQLPGRSGSGVGGASGRKTTYWGSVARIGLQVAGALSYAHRLGVLHRDIKPANLLLDLDGVVWVTDFGLAKADDSDDLTHTGDLLGTLRYMPPEAFEGKSDARSDVYSLGLTLFELVALRPAYEERDRNRLVVQVTTGGPPRLRKLRADAPRDLVTVVEKATAKDPARRYQTAGALADDLQRFLAGRPITARRATEVEKLWMWARRRPAIAGLVAALFLCLIAGSVVSTVFAVRADGFARDAELREKDATSARDTARRNAADAEAARDDAKKREGEAVAARDEAKQTRNAAARQAAGLLLDKGIEDARGGEPARALHLFVRALRTLPSDDRRAASLERVIRANLSAWAETVPTLEQIWPDRVRFQDVAFTPDGEVIALPDGKDEIRCFRTDTGRPVGPPISVPFDRSSPMVFAPDGRSLWAASPGRWNVPKPGAVHRFDPATGRPIRPPIPTAGPVVRLVVTPDGRHLVGAVSELHPGDTGGEKDADHTRKWRTASIVVWEAATGGEVRTVIVNAETDYATANAWPDAYVSLSRDGQSVIAWVERGANGYEQVTFSVDGKEPPVRQKLPAVGPGALWRLHFEKNMRTGLVVKEGQVHRWSAAEPGVLGPGLPTPFRSMLYGPSADGRSVISPVAGRVFDTGAWPPRPSGVRFAHPGWARSTGPWMEQSPDGQFLATWIWTAGSDARLWRLPRPHSRPTLPLAELARQPQRRDYQQFAQFDPRGTVAVLWAHQQYDATEQPVDNTHHIRLVDATTGAVRGTSVRHTASVREAVFTPDGRYCSTGSWDGTARVWETATGRPAGPPLQHINYVATVAFSPDGNTLATGDYASNVRLWDWRTGKETTSLRHDDIVLNVSFSPDGRYLAVLKAPDWSKKPELLVWEVASGKEVIRVSHTCPGYLLRETARFRPDSRAVASRDVNGVLHLWDVPSGNVLGKRPLDGDGVTRFSPDGRVVAAAANLGVRLLDGNTLDPLPGGYLPHPDPITDVAFSPDGAYLLTAHETGSAQLWDVAECKPVGPPAALIGPIRAVTFTPDGKTCVCVAADGTVRRWSVPAPFAEPDLTRLIDRVALLTGQRMDNNEGLDSVPPGEWQALRARLVGDGSTALVPPRPDADWHDAVAADAGQDGDAIGAEWHLDRLAKLRPNDWIIPARRGRVLAAAGRRDEAAAAYAAAARLAPSPQVLSDWHRAAAADDEAAGRKEAALWNLDRAVALTPDDWTLYALRAGLGDPARAVADLDEAVRRGAEPGIVVRAAVRAAESGDWPRTATLFNVAARTPTLSTQARYLQAVANLKAGDAAGYRAACGGIAERLPPVGPKLPAGEANAAAMAFALGPNATGDWTKPVAWIDHALARLAAAEKANPDKKDGLRRERHALLNTRGAVLYRAGRFEESAKTLREGMSFHADGGEFHDWLFLALAEHRLGRAAAAGEAAVKARAVRPKSKTDANWEQAEVELLAAELDAAQPPAVR